MSENKWCKPIEENGRHACEQCGFSLKTGKNFTRLCGPRKQRLKAIRENRTERPSRESQSGPGSQLIRIMEEAGVPHCQACLDLAAKMDAWGPDGCTERLDEIMAGILPRAREWLSAERPWVHRLLSATSLEDAALRLAIRQKVKQAIELAIDDLLEHDCDPE